MNVIRKDATITNTDDTYPGSFEVVLSTGTKDRDGEEVRSDEWVLPLPDHITFDVDHGMSVAATVGSGIPSIDKDGRLVVSGTYSSLQKAQDVRTLVNEKHIRNVSVAFARMKTTKDGIIRTQRELLNGAFVAIPANTEAVVLASKTAVKTGARNSKADQEHLDAIAAHAIALGAQVETGGDTEADEDVAAAKSFQAAVIKTVGGSYEQTQQAISDALNAAYSDDDDDRYVYAYPLATFPTTVVYRISGNTDLTGQWQAGYTTADDGTITLGNPSRVNLVEQIVPVNGDTEDAGESAAAPTAAAAKAAAAPGNAAEEEALELQARAARFRLYSTEAAL